MEVCASSQPEHQIDEMKPCASVRVSYGFRRFGNGASSFRLHETIPFSLFINMGQKLYFC
jgi:hypothetical protein